MIKAKFVQGGNVAPGTVVGLAYEQAEARAHLLAPLKARHDGAKDQRRLPFKAVQALYFKAGEQIGVEGPIDRHLQMALGLSDEDVVEAGAAKPGLVAKVKSGRKRSQKAASSNAALEKAQAAVEAARSKLDAAGEAERDDAQTALDAALAEVSRLQAQG